MKKKIAYPLRLGTILANLAKGGLRHRRSAAMYELLNRGGLNATTQLITGGTAGYGAGTIGSSADPREWKPEDWVKAITMGLGSSVIASPGLVAKSIRNSRNMQLQGLAKQIGRDKKFKNRLPLFLQDFLIPKLWAAGVPAIGFVPSIISNLDSALANTAKASESLAQTMSVGGMSESERTKLVEETLRNVPKSLAQVPELVTAVKDLSTQLQQNIPKATASLEGLEGLRDVGQGLQGLTGLSDVSKNLEGVGEGVSQLGQSAKSLGTFSESGTEAIENANEMFSFIKSNKIPLIAALGGAGFGVGALGSLALLPAALKGRDKFIDEIDNTLTGEEDKKEKKAIVQREGDEWVLYTKDKSRVLGRHSNPRKAYAQEYAILKSQNKVNKQASFRAMAKQLITA